MALASYYCGVFGLVTCFLLPVAIFGAAVPLVLGILGLMKAQKDENAHGRLHAWVGIGLGTLELLVGCGSLAFFGFSIIAKR